jgi:CRISPR-associated endonuclease/helicase Cas3
MTMIPLSGVALREHDMSYPAPKITPYGHQCALHKLFQNEDGFVAVNDSPTGGGKTISWLAPTVESREHAIAVYPTNALIADQKEAIEEELDVHFPKYKDDIKVLSVTSKKLRTKYAEQYPQYDTNHKILQSLLNDSLWEKEQVILLTNPDILVLMYRNLYHGGFGYQNSGDIIREVNEFSTAIVDEFHRASRKEQNTLLFLLDEMCEKDVSVCALSKLVFLSATPEERLERRFDEAMSASYHRVTVSDQRERMAFDTPSTPTGWRSVMPPTDLEVRSASTFATADTLLGDDWDNTQSFCARDGKTVVILDGIHEVEEVTRELQEALPNQRVERIDGFHRGEMEAKLERFDVLVSNSAVEVGIDFEVKRLIFSGHNRASFLQRLGRIRGRIEDGATVRESRCYIPSSVAKRLREKTDRSKGRVSRADLTTWLEDAYDDPREPETFDWRYSAAEALAHVETQAGKYVGSEAALIQEEGEKRIDQHFSHPEKDIGVKEIKQFADTVSEDVKKALQQYRGESLNALVYDVSADSENELKTYDPFYLLRHGDVKFFSKAEFLREVPHELHDVVKSHASYVVGFCVYQGTIPTNEGGYGRSVSFKATPSVFEWLKRETNLTSRTPQKVALSVDVEGDGHSRVPSINHIRSKMETKENEILCYAVEGTSREVKNRYRLGDFFFLYPLSYPDTELCVALGTDALYLHCRVQEEESKFDFTDLGLDLGP